MNKNLGGGNFDVQIVKQNWSASDPISGANRETLYDNCLAGTADNNIWQNTTGITFNQIYTSGNLDTSWVLGTGYTSGFTYYSLRSSKDKAGTAPTGAENVAPASYDNASTSARPVLTVAYTKANGKSCTVGGECTSGNCPSPDNVCCNTACTGSLCQRCDSYSNAGSGTCGYISSAVDPDNECATVCPTTVWGWNGNNCTAYTAASGDGMCTGTSTACNTTTGQSCTDSSGTTIQSCGSSQCVNASACVKGSASTTSDTPGKICYTSGNHGCPTGQICDATGTCNPPPNCSSVPVNGDFTISDTSCALPGTGIVGIDKGTGTINTAKLTIGSGKFLTVLGNQTVAVGTIDLKGGGTINIISGGSIKVGTPIYYQDADNDTHPNSALTTKSLTGGTGWARYEAGLDCNDVLANGGANVFSSTTCYIDNDGDNWTNSTVNCTNNATCTSATYGGVGTATPTSYTAGHLLATSGSGTDANDAQYCPDISYNPGGTCQECSFGANANQDSSHDRWGQCTTGGGGTGTVCRSPNCSGTGAACGFLTGSTTCRTAADICDAAETCSGSADTCPTDAFLPSSTNLGSGSCKECTGAAAAPILQASNEDRWGKCAAGSCANGYCSGLSDTCSYVDGGTEGSCATCQMCNGSQSTCINVTNNTQDTQGANLCNAACKACQSGSCGNADINTDPGNLCTPATSVKTNDASGINCATRCGQFSCVSAAGNCNGSGSCITNTCQCWDLGTDGPATDNTYESYSGGCTKLSGATYSTVMTDLVQTCLTRKANWTNCQCGY